MDALDVRARGGTDASALGGVGDERAQPLAEALGRRGDDRHLDAECLLGASDGLVVEEGDDGLAKRHALDREQPVPAGVQLVDDDVGVAEELERLVVMETLDDLEVGVESFARSDHMFGALSSARRRRVQDHRTCAVRGRGRFDPGEVDAGRDHLSLRHPPDRVVGADNLGAGLLSEGELVARLAPDVRAEVVEDGLLPQRP